MASRKRGRIIPARTSKPDVRANRHRFQGFQERVATLKINPVQKARFEDEKRTESYFAARIAYWREINLSEPFADFTKAVSPFCDSLVQILHHEQQIADLLASNLEAQNALSLEPLLDLSSQLAHDLGHRFEKHYSRFISIIVRLVSGHQDVEVLEWAFNTLAWMFQFLSRLLVPNLLPTFDILSPLLGKEVRKGHIARFAAEAMSFLMRKAALRAERDEQPLRSIVSHIADDWVLYRNDVSNDDLVYSYGLMHLFADCIKDIKSANAIRPYGALVLKVLFEESLRCKSLDLVKGVTTNIIHHTDAESFAPILHQVTEQIKACGTDASVDIATELCGLLDVVVEVRRGDRISDWDSVFTSLKAITSSLGGKLVEVSSKPGLVYTRTAAALIQRAPFNAIGSRLDAYIRDLTGPGMPYDLPQFYLYASTLNRERFDQFLRPFFFNYLAETWNAQDVRLLFAARSILNDAPEGSVLVNQDRLAHQTWPDSIATFIQDWEQDEEISEIVDTMLKIAHVLRPDCAPSERISHAIAKQVNTFLKQPAPRASRAGLLLLGAALRWHLEHVIDRKSTSEVLSDRLVEVYHQFGRVPAYIQNLCLTFDAKLTTITPSEELLALLTSNLSTDSKALRTASLKLLLKLNAKDFAVATNPLKHALRIEEMPLDHESVRSVSMLIRNFRDSYNPKATPKWINYAIIHYLFGLMTFNLTPLWSDATEALRAVYDAGFEGGTQLLEDLVFRWLDERSSGGSANPPPAGDDTSPSLPQITEFHCTSHEEQNRVFANASSSLTGAMSHFRVLFDQTHALVTAVPQNSVSQAIKVLKAVPDLAERRSRRLVPLFLAWASSDEDSESTLVGDLSPDRQAQNGPSIINRPDKKAMLEVFGALSNPKALYRSNDVYRALLHLLSNGDGAIQKGALKALATWKKPGLKIYRDHFDNLLDNARFREELTLFLPQKVAEKGLTETERSEMIEILMPLLFGRVTARGKSSAGKMTQGARRKAVFESLGTFPDEEIATFVDVALGPLRSVEVQNGSFAVSDLGNVHLSLRRQLGFVRLAKDLLDCIGDKLMPRSGPLVNAILYCLSRVQTGHTDDGDHEVEDDVGHNEAALQKAIRQAGLQSLTLISKFFVHGVVEPFFPLMLQTVIEPRLGARFPAENAQSVSSLLRLFAAWASDVNSANFLVLGQDILYNLIECLSTVEDSSIVKPAVKVFIIREIMLPLAEAHHDRNSTVTIPNDIVSPLISNLASILENDRTKELVEVTVSLVLKLAPGALDLESDRLARVLSTMLGMPSREVKPATKGQALELLEQCVGTTNISSEVIRNLWQVLSKQFGTLHGPWRSQLGRTFASLGQKIGDRHVAIADLARDLNSFVKDRLEEPDLQKRARAFEAITKTAVLEGDEEWLPIVHNALFFVQDQEETFIRKNSSQLLRHFVDANTDMEVGADRTFPSSKLLKNVLLQALRRGASDRSEIVRVEYLSVMEQVVRKCPQWTEIADMSSLTASAEDGESFFSGAIHIQQEWRKRSLIKLARVARQGRLSSENIAHFILPLIEHFVFDRAEETDTHSLAAQTITTIGALMSCMDWVQARKSLRRYTNLIKENPDLEKAVIRLVGVVTEAIYTAKAGVAGSGRLAASIPALDPLAEDISDTLLPPLLSFLHHKDEAVVSLRVPVAVSAARLICLLPETTLEHRLAPVLTDVCNILRSKAQESRDLSRKTLAEITALIGPRRFSFILKELRIALSRGYQLHVKSYTLHSLIVASNFQPGDLDYCLSDIMQILLDDIFGATGQEKDADGYTNKAKEVKSGKSMDSAERLAQISTVSHLSDFIAPLRKLLLERIDARRMTKLDELLRRIGSGLQQNASLGSQSALVFCFLTLQQASSAAAQVAKKDNFLTQEEQQRRDRFEIKTKSAKKAPMLSQVSSQQYKLARFAFDLLRIVLHRHENLRTPANLVGFLTPIGDVLLEAQEEVQIAALRLLAGIVKVPMKQWESNAPVYAVTAFSIVQNQPDTNTELSQAAIKLLTALLREGPKGSLKDAQVAKLTKQIIPDLTQPARQGVTFNFLKAVVSQRVVCNEVYEAMDSAAKLFVTSGDGNARNQARSIWLQFVLNYEQSEKRFRQQIDFLAQNLSYQHSEGRQSVLEAINFLLGKLDPEHLQKAVVSFFLPLVDKTVNDDVAACRDMAALLLKSVFQKADDDNYSMFRVLVQKLFAQQDKPKNRTTALQLCGLMIESDAGRAGQDLKRLQGWLQEITSAATEGDVAEWEMVYAALKLATTMCESFSGDMFSSNNSDFWSTITALSSFPHAWVKSAAVKLLGLYLSQFESSNGGSASKESVKSASGLQMTKAQAERLAQAYFGSLWREVPEWLASNMAENLDVIERFAGEWPTPSRRDTSEETDSEMDDEDELGENAGRDRPLRALYFNRISALVRRESSLLSKLTALQLLGTLVRRCTVAQIEPMLHDILSPLNHLTDSSISSMTQTNDVADEQQRRLNDISYEIIAELQRKLPDGEYVRVMHSVQQAMRKRRDERRSKRRIEAVADPERSSRDKFKKRARGRERKRERNEIHRSRRRGW